MAPDDITLILIELEGLKKEIFSLKEGVRDLGACPVASSRLTFNLKQVVAIILAIATINIASGTATFYAMRGVDKAEIGASNR